MQSALAQHMHSLWQLTCSLVLPDWYASSPAHILATPFIATDIATPSFSGTTFHGANLSVYSDSPTRKCVMQVGPPPAWLNERKPDEWKPRDVANAVLIDRYDTHHTAPTDAQLAVLATGQMFDSWRDLQPICNCL